MNTKPLSVLKYIILLIIAVGLLFLAFRGISIKSILHNLLQAKISWILLSVLLSLGAFISRAFRWNLLIEPLGFSPPLRKTTYALMIGYLANLAFPRLGEVTRCGSLSKSESIPFSSLLGTVIIERIIDLISLFICLFLVALVEYERLENFLALNIVQPLSGKWKQLVHAQYPFIIGILVIVILIFTIFYVIRRPREKSKESKFEKLIDDLYKGLRSLGKLERPWLFLFHSVLIWLLYFLSVYTCFFSLPSTSHLGLGAGLLILVVGGLGMSAPVQGGIGAYHLLVSQGLILYGLTTEEGLTFATLIHTLSMLIVVIFILLFSENKKKVKLS